MRNSLSKYPLSTIDSVLYRVYSVVNLRGGNVYYYWVIVLHGRDIIFLLDMVSVNLLTYLELKLSSLIVITDNKRTSHCI